MSSTVLGLDGGRAQAIGLLIEAYDGVPTLPGKGLPHAQAVADILRDAGSSEVTQLVGLLHDVVEDTSCNVEDVRDGFGDDVAAMVAALTADDAIDHYLPRKRALRAKIEVAGSPVVDVALADEIAPLRHALTTGTRVTKRKLAHYRATLQLALAAGEAPRLCAQLEQLLV